MKRNDQTRMQCDGIRKDGQSCTFKAKYNGKCGYHKTGGYHKDKDKDKLTETKNNNNDNDKITDLIEQINKISVENDDLKLQIKRINGRLNKLNKKVRRKL